jgi:hypothetical protein
VVAVPRFRATFAFIGLMVRARALGAATLSPVAT